MYQFILLNVADSTRARGGGSSTMLSTLLMFGAIFAVMYFFMIRPQSKKQKELQLMLDNIRVNDKVLTGGGIIGKVTSIKPDKNIFVIEIDDTNHIRVEFQKSSVVAVLSKDEGQPA